jgi:septum formation topological specificity factor MinE
MLAVFSLHDEAALLLMGPISTSTRCSIGENAHTTILATAAASAAAAAAASVVSPAHHIAAFAGSARQKMLQSVRTLLLAAPSKQPEVLEQLQQDLLSLLQKVVLPGLSAYSSLELQEQCKPHTASVAMQSAGSAGSGPQLTAMSRIISGELTLNITSST